MVVAYGSRTAETSGSYDDASAAGAVAAFLLMRGQHWLMAIEPLKTMNVTTARLMTSDFGAPLGNVTQDPAHHGVFMREFEKATVSLDCNDFSGTFTPKHA